MKIDKYMPALRRMDQQTKTATRGERVLSSMFLPGSYGAWSGWGQDNLYQQVQHYRNWVYVCVDLIAAKIASVTPNFAYVSDEPRAGHTVKAGRRGMMNVEGRGFGGTPTISHGGHSFLTMGEYRSKALSVIKPHENIEPLEGDHPLRRLWENPNPVDTDYDLAYELVMFLKLCGVAYVWMVPNDYGVPCELYVMPSHWVWPRTGGGRYINDATLERNPHADELIQSFEIRPWGTVGTAGNIYIPPDQMVMFRSKSPLDKIRGYSPQGAIAMWLDTEESITKSQWAQMSNVARPELWIELGAGYEDPDDDRVERMEAKVAAKLQGEYNTGVPLITSPGAKVSVLSFNPSDMAYGESDERVANKILSTYKVPKAAVGIGEQMTYGSILAMLASLCLDEETECLTSNGWKKHGELSDETRIACYDEPTGTIVYRQPKRIVREQYKGPMHKWSGVRIDAMMTPAHRIFTKRESARPLVNPTIPWGIIRVDEMTKATTYKIKRTAPAACDTPGGTLVASHAGYRQAGSIPKFHHEIEPDVWLRFLGHWISEGHTRTRTIQSNGGYGTWDIGVSQSPDSLHFKSIQESLDATPFEWKWNGVGQWRANDKGLYYHLRKHCGEKSDTKRIPEYVKAWPAANLRVLLDALVEGDGKDPKVTENTGVWWTTYTTVSKQLADDVMEIAIKCGLSASIHVRRGDERNGQPGEPNRKEFVYLINLSSRSDVLVTPSARSIVDYEGTIWCVEVPTGLFVVRRNGKAHITGNCEGALNPCMTMVGKTATKNMASRWDERTPAFSSNTGKAGGYSGTGVHRRVVMWYDDTVPANPQQVNDDIQTDIAAYAITPNMVLAMRGREPYAHGGDDPIVNGPGGPAPLPLNTGESTDLLAELTAAMSKPAQEAAATEGLASEGLDKKGDETKVGVPEEQPEQKLDSATAANPATDAGPPENPNGRPQKWFGVGVTKMSADQLKVGDKISILNKPCVVIDFGDWKQLKQRYPSAAQDALANLPSHVTEDKLGRTWAIKYEDGHILLLGKAAIPLFIVPRKAWKGVHKDQGKLIVAGLAVLARDTGRVLMHQRSLEPGDPAGGTWEFPGGHIDPGEGPLEAALREWCEEVGLPLPDGRMAGSWTSHNGVYQGFVYLTPAEAAVDLLHGRGEVTNPDGDHFEAVAWVRVDELNNHNLRPQLLVDLAQIKDVLRTAIKERGVLVKSWDSMEDGGEFPKPDDEMPGDEVVDKGPNAYTFNAEDCPKCGASMEGDSYTGKCNSCGALWGIPTGKKKSLITKRVHVVPHGGGYTVARLGESKPLFENSTFPTREQAERYAVQQGLGLVKGRRKSPSTVAAAVAELSHLWTTCIQTSVSYGQIDAAINAVAAAHTLPELKDITRGLGQSSMPSSKSDFARRQITRFSERKGRMERGDVIGRIAQGKQMEKKLNKRDVDEAAARYQSALIQFGENNMATDRAQMRFMDLKTQWEQETGKKYGAIPNRKSAGPRSRLK